MTTRSSHDARVDTYQVPVPKDVPWPQPFDAQGVARSLDVTLSLLWYHVLYANKQYTRHTIPKKSGGTRVLHVPREELAWHQRRFLRAYLDRFTWPEHVSAYVLGRSPQDAAAQHAGRPVLIVVDIKDFFPSTKRKWVRDALRELLYLPAQASEVLATLVTAPWDLRKNERFRVPQGAPSSGAVANLVALHRLDPEILEACAAHGMTYTRYADDLAFSRPTPMDGPEASEFIKKVITAIRRAGYRVNYDKIRVQRRNRQQRLLGLTINEFPNIPAKQYRNMRAMVHHCTTRGLEAVAAAQGFESPEAVEAYVHGILAYYEGVNPAKAARLRERYR